ncbi:MAG: sigma-70 family RNA polymerase sigma factor [Pseudomonadota bacterium]
MDRNDLDLLDRIRRGDPRALHCLYLAHRPRMTRLALRIVASRDDAEEVVNDTFFVVWRSVERFEARSKVSTWLLGITHRLALKHLERERTQLRLATQSMPYEALVNALEETPSVNRSDDPAGNLIGAELTRVALDALPPQQRVAAELVLLRGHSYQEVALIEGCPVNTVKTRVFHARRRMRQALAEGAAP